MQEDLNLKVAMKQHTILLVIYVICDIIVFSYMTEEISMEDLIRMENFKWEIEKIFLIFVICTAVCGIIFLKKRVNCRNAMCYWIGIECIFFSVVMLIMVSKECYYSNWRLWFIIPFSYIIIVFILFCLNRNFYKKLPDGDDEYNKKNTGKAGKGSAAASGGALIGMSISNWEEKHHGQVPHLFIPLFIIYGWLALGWFFFQARKKNIKGK